MFVLLEAPLQLCEGYLNNLLQYHKQHPQLSLHREPEQPKTALCCPTSLAPDNPQHPILNPPKHQNLNPELSTLNLTPRRPEAGGGVRARARVDVHRDLAVTRRGCRLVVEFIILVAEWKHFTLCGIILPTITQQLRIGFRV